jgi:hypothetical protein
MNQDSNYQPWSDEKFEKIIKRAKFSNGMISKDNTELQISHKSKSRVVMKNQKDYEGKNIELN